MKLLLILLLLGGNYDHDVKKSTQGATFIEQRVDRRIERLEVALKGTLLEGQEQVFVEVADEYGFDYWLLPSISFAESSICRNFPRSTFNCWGWNSAKTSFESFEDAIRTIGYKLATLSYYEAWRQDKDIMTLAKTYCAADNEHWVSKINYFYNKL